MQTKAEQKHFSNLLSVTTGAGVVIGMGADVGTGMGADVGTGMGADDGTGKGADDGTGKGAGVVMGEGVGADVVGKREAIAFSTARQKLINVSSTVVDVT